MNTFRSTRRRALFALVLLAALVLLVLTGLGVFRLHFDFEWMAGDDAAGQLFSLKIRGGNAFDPLAAEPFGIAFWVTVVILVLLAVALPFARLLLASLLAIAAALAVLALHLRYSPSLPRIPVEFALLIVLVLYAVHVLLAYIAELRDRKRLSRLLSQYVPPELTALYGRDPDRLGLAGEERELSVLFCDVVGFSAIGEQLAPQQVARWLNGFFSLVSHVVVRHRGTIDKYMGDSVMAVWGAPAPSDTHAADALAAAFDIHAELETLNARYREEGLPEVGVGVGLSSGRANVGPLGSQYRMDYTVVGDTVNVARRLEAQTRKYGVPVIVSDGTVERLPDMLFRELDTVQVKGRRRPVTMYQPLGAAAAADGELTARLALHREAMTASKAGDWSRAIALFTRLRDEWGPRDMYELYLRGIARVSG